MAKITGFIGIFLFILLAWLLSENRKIFNRRIVIWGLALQLVFALFILKTKIGYLIFNFAKIIFGLIIDFSDKGAGFIFGSLVNDVNIGAVMAFKVLPIIIFVSSLSGVLYYLGIIQFFINFMAKIMQKTMKISGAESFGSSLLVFMGIESMTAIKKYIHNMTRSELFTIMSAFMATIASSVMATYASFGAEPGHLLTASIMSAPAAILIAKIMIPETGVPVTVSVTKIEDKKDENNIVEAAANGASMGMHLALQTAAMLIAFIALIWMINSVFSLFHTSFDKIMGYIFAPFAFVMGIPWNESVTVGQLLGTRTVFNEFLAYLKLQELIKTGALSPRTITIATYALCGFANFGSMAILIGGIGGIAPSRKKEVAELGIKSIIAGTLASFMTAAIAGILI